MGTYLYRRGNGVWYILVKEPGAKPKHISTKQRNKGAAHEVFKQFQSGESKEKNRDITISELDILMNERLSLNLRQSTLHGYSVILRQLRNIIGDKLIKEITVDDIEKYKIDRTTPHNNRPGIKPVTLHIEIRALKSIFNRCVKWKLLNISPTIDTELPVVKKTIAPYITEKDFTEFIKGVTNPLLNDVFRFAMYTGCRLGEILHLKYDDINFESNNIFIRDSDDHLTKTEESERVLPIPPLLIPMLKNRFDHRKGDYLFNRNGYRLQQSYLSHNFKSAIRAAKMDERLHFHSLRHSYSCMMISRGTDLYVLSQLMGHADISMLQRVYAHLNDETKQNAVKKLTIEEKKRAAVESITEGAKILDISSTLKD